MAASTAFENEADRFAGTPHPRHARALIGHADHERELLSAYRNGRLPHAIIIGGPAGVGKATLAWRLTRFLLAHPPQALASISGSVDLAVPSTSKAFGEVSALSHPDVALLRREFNEKARRFFTEIRADDVRRAIGLFQRGAAAGGYRICIVDSAEDLNRSSANALLKLIEEPPPLSLFLLIANRPGLVLPTIRSRCRLMRLGSLPAPDIETVIATLGPPWSDKGQTAISEAAARAQGSVQDALRRLDPEGRAFEASIERVLARLPSVDWKEVHRVAEAVAGRDGETAFETAVMAACDWITRTIRDSAGTVPPGRSAALADAWDRIATSVRETDALNLDRRPAIIAMFDELASASRALQA